MTKKGESAYERLRARYTSGDLPWDETLPPPEVIELVDELPPGRALDLGCGYGRASIYLALKGWQVDGIDFVPEALVEAARRTDEAGVYIDFHLAEVTSLDFLKGPYDFALDVGCGHSLDEEELVRYRDQLKRLLHPGAYFLMFARLREEEDRSNPDDLENGPSGLDEALLIRIFKQGFSLEWSERGLTKMPEQFLWASGWFRFRRST